MKTKQWLDPKAGPLTETGLYEQHTTSAVLFEDTKLVFNFDDEGAVDNGF